MIVFAVVLVYSIVIGIEIRPMIKRRKWRNIILYLVTMSGSFAINLLLSLNINIPSPVKPIENFITMIFGK